MHARVTRLSFVAKDFFFLDVVRRIQQFKTVLPVLTESSTRWYAERKIPFVSRL